MCNFSVVGLGYIVMVVDLIYIIIFVVKNGMLFVFCFFWVRLVIVVVIIKLIMIRECVMLYVVYVFIRS